MEPRTLDELNAQVNGIEMREATSATLRRASDDADESITLIALEKPAARLFERPQRRLDFDDDDDVVVDGNDNNNANANATDDDDGDADDNDADERGTERSRHAGFADIGFARRESSHRPHSSVVAMAIGGLKHSKEMRN